VSQGSWLEAFQSLPVPFDLGLFCPPSSSDGAGPLSADPHAYRVLVVRKPFGMNVQVNVLPRVTDVLPGSLAERAGVRRGFVLKSVNDVPVDARNWLAVWEKASAPCTLTFDTDVPLHENNPFFNESRRSDEKAGGSPAVPYKVEDDTDLADDFGDFRCTVNALPFGMRVSAPPGGRPTVNTTVSGLPAEKEGVLPGDVLVEVAGRSVDSSTWFAAFEQAVPPFGLRFRRRGAPSEAATAEKGVVGRLDVVVSEKPFGMHVRRGSAIVDDVFAGFPAKKLGVRKGCQVKEIAGKAVFQGTWLEVFQKAALPFNISLICPPTVADMAKHLSGDEHRYRTLVTQRPFGMNVQVNVLPRVVEVLPGSPAERAGVRRGFVLTEVNSEPVGASNWFDVWQKAPTPSTLTFDTSVPLHEGNPFFNGTVSVSASTEAPKADETDVGDGFSDVRIKVAQLPFGMHVRSVPGGRPTVSHAVPGLPAAAEGVRAGDVLVEVACLPVDSSTWFAAFQQAVPPFGLRLRRPNSAAPGGSGAAK
jgi:S1-C subfamily serine protease